MPDPEMGMRPTVRHPPTLVDPFIISHGVNGSFNKIARFKSHPINFVDFDPTVNPK